MRYTLLLSALLLGSVSFAQRLADLARPIPAALSTEAPLPAALAQKYERAKADRYKKYTTPSAQTSASVDSEIIQWMNSYLSRGAEAYQIAYKASDNYRIYNPLFRILNTSHGREKTKGEDGKFNVKKDRMSYAILRNGNEICIVNHAHKLVDMSDFTFSTTSDAIRIEDGNKIALNVPVVSIAQGEYPLLHKVKCTHVSSGAEYTFDIQMSWNKKLNLSGEKHAFALTTLDSKASDDLGLLCDLYGKMLMVVELPLVIDGDGRNGANGAKGRYGANGTNQSSYKDSNGNTHTTAGTCGKPGEDGSDGEDGTDGGKFLFCISPELVAAYGLDGLIATVDAGLGGKGGKGGEGGIHGKGSGCTGKAADGKNGRDGKDGKQGDFLYVLADVNGFYQQIFK